MKNLIFFTLLLLASSCNNSSQTKTGKQDLKDLKPKIIPPFQDLDTLATNDWWNRGPNPIIKMDVDRKELIAFGIYTLANNTLKLSAQLFPLYPYESRTVRLEVEENGKWQEIQKQDVNDIGWSALFRVEGWDMTKDKKYRLLHGEHATFEGLIRRDPVKTSSLVMQ